MTKAVLTSSVEIKDSVAFIDFTSENADFETNSNLFQAAREQRDVYASEMVTSTANEAKQLFADNEAINMVTGTMLYGGTTLGATVHRSYQVDGSEEAISNHVVFESHDDFTNMVNSALEGIFDAE